MNRLSLNKISTWKLPVFFLFMLIVTTKGNAQIQRKTFNGFLFGMNIGLNSGKLQIDSIPTDPALLPTFAVNVEKKMLPFLAFRFATGYSRRGSNSVNKIYEYRNDYFDMNFQLRALAGHYFKFSLGYQRAGLIGSYVRIYDKYLTYVSEWEKTTDFRDQYHWQAGMSLALVKSMDFEINYLLPATGHDFHNIMFSINIYPGKFKRKRKLKKFTSLAGAMAKPDAVEKLVLHRQNLDKIPPEVYSLVNLKELVLDGNKIKTVSAEIAKLTELRYFSLKYNLIVELPPEIGKLKKLEELDLRQNQLKKLPKEIGELSNLRFLYIGKNNLESLPDELGNLSKLVELDLAYSGVMLTVPYQVIELKQLEWLYIDRTTILPYSFFINNPRFKILLK